MSTPRDNRTVLFERLLQPHMERLFRLAYRLTHRKAEAEDLFQDVLTKTFARLEELQSVRDPGPWLSRVLYNHFIDHQRRYQRRRLTTADNAQIEAQPAGRESDSRRLANIAALETALGRLSDEHRTVVLLHDAEGYKLEEIQELTGTPVGTIKSRLHRARSRLREILDSDGTE